MSPPDWNRKKGGGEKKEKKKKILYGVAFYEWVTFRYKSAKKKQNKKQFNE